jgi:hypothetical protein
LEPVSISSPPEADKVPRNEFRRAADTLNAPVLAAAPESEQRRMQDRESSTRTVCAGKKFR